LRRQTSIGFGRYSGLWEDVSQLFVVSGDIATPVNLDIVICQCGWQDADITLHTKHGIRCGTQTHCAFLTVCCTRNFWCLATVMQCKWHFTVHVQQNEEM